MKRLVCCVAFSLTWSVAACGSSTTPPPAATKDSTGSDTVADTQTDTATSDATGDGIQAVDTTSDSSDIAVGPPCGSTPVNDGGLGKPCSKPDDCFGQPAVTCIDGLGASAPRFCVQYCFGMPGECGSGGVCVPRGPKQASVCMPVQCAAKYTVEIPNDVTCTQPCGAGNINSFGVGKPCSVMADCSANLAAKTCPVVLRPDNPNWCSMLCTEDSECGDNAVCWRRKTVEYGVEFVVGSCAPASCCGKAK